MLATQTKNEANKVVESALARVGEIATLPEVTVKIIRIVENPKSTARDLHDVIRVDPALSSRLLKVVNSAFYGLPGQIASMDRAIVLLGLSAVKNIAIASSMSHLFNGGRTIEGFSGLELWRHSVAVAVTARLLTTAQGRPSVEESFLAGLIHDLGLLIERQVYPKEMAQIISRQKAQAEDFATLEQEIIGADHAAFGMALATKWRFPRPLCTSIGYHHKPMDLTEVNRELPVLINIADILASRAGIGFTATSASAAYTDEMLHVVKLTQADLDEIAANLPEQVALTESIFSD